MTDALDEARLAHAAMPLPTGVMGRPDAAWLARLVLAADDTWRAAGKPAGDDPIVQSHWLSWADGQALMKRNNELLAEIERLRADVTALVETAKAGRKGMRQADTGWTAHVGPPAVKDMEELAQVLREQHQREKDVAALVDAAKAARKRLHFAGGRQDTVKTVDDALAPFTEPAKPRAEQTAPADRPHETGLFGGPPGFCNRAGRWCPRDCSADRPACGSQGDSPQDVINRLAALEAAELERGERERNVAKAAEKLVERLSGEWLGHDGGRAALAALALAQAVHG